MSAPVTRVVRRVVKKESAEPQRAPLPDEPYAGLIDVAPGAIITSEANAGLSAGDVARTAPHLLVTGQTGGGKTRSVLGPNIIRWGSRPVVAMSSKGDMAELTIRKRAQHGPVYLMDLSGEVRESELRGIDVTRVRCDPCAMITTDDEALDLADLLMETSDGGEGGGDSQFWKNLARRRLAAFLRAGGTYPNADGEPTWGGGVAWALAACEDVGDVEDKGPDPDAPVDLVTPNWDVAARRCAMLSSSHTQSLLAAKKMDARQRDSIGINCQSALAPWALQSLAENSAPAFLPEMLEARGATLFLVSPMGGAAAPAASLVLVSIVNHWRKRVGKLRTILFVLDEFTNGSKIPAKRALGWIGEGRSLGVRLCMAVQGTSQIALLWGEAATKVLREICPAILVLPGPLEKDLMDGAAWAALPEERVTASRDASGRVSQGREKLERSAAELIPRRKGEGRLLLSGLEGVKVSLPDIAATDLLD
ncbi:type IV secretory system conjugative DNA transfer family protein [uncultured Gordonia sp.]|uniref:type IV secretory system conjugative DNA transfer family protein n=1 Tax=uncultured Gordonia sp. TaxID=198437 RepID=UPI0026029908|nr:type IV secretory system conjugative DNA transfer family protein [uncultured Gordonia sp.]